MRLRTPRPAVWWRIATAAEQELVTSDRGTGLCTRLDRYREHSAEFDLLRLFEPDMSSPFWWPIVQGNPLFLCRSLGATRADRVLAAWLCYWMAVDARKTAQRRAAARKRQRAKGKGASR